VLLVVPAKILVLLNIINHQLIECARNVSRPVLHVMDLPTPIVSVAKCRCIFLMDSVPQSAVQGHTHLLMPHAKPVMQIAISV